MLFYIGEAQGNLLGQFNYCNVFNPPEKDLVHDILSAYQKSLVEKYFRGELLFNFYTYSLRSEDYFMCTLENYLSDHECNLTFAGHKMYEELERKNYGYWGTQLYDATYSLTEFGTLYNKLYYVVRLYCESSKAINKKNTMFHYAEKIKERIDAGKIQISVL